MDEIHNLIEDKDKLLNQLDECKIELNKTNQEKEKLVIGKAKLEIQTRRKNDLQDKIETLGKEKSNYQKEIEILKLQNHNSKLNLEKVNTENKNLHHEIQTLQTEVEKLKQSPNIVDASISHNKANNILKKVINQLL